MGICSFSVARSLLLLLLPLGLLGNPPGVWELNARLNARIVPLAHMYVLLTPARLRYQSICLRLLAHVCLYVCVCVCVVVLYVFTFEWWRGG